MQLQRYCSRHTKQVHPTRNSSGSIFGSNTHKQANKRSRNISCLNKNIDHHQRVTRAGGSTWLAAASRDSNDPAGEDSETSSSNNRINSLVDVAADKQAKQQQASTTAATAADSAADAASTARPASTRLNNTSDSASVTSVARRNLLRSWQELRDAAGAVLDGLGGQKASEVGAAAQPSMRSQGTDSSTKSQQDQQESSFFSLSDRFKRLLTGQFIRELEAANDQLTPPRRGPASSQQQQQPSNLQSFAVQFEMRQRFQQQQPPQQPLRGQDSTAAAVSIDADGIIDVTAESAESLQQTFESSSASAADGGADEDLPKPDTTSPKSFYAAGTQMLILLMWGVFVVQWLPAAPDLWQVIQAGRPLEAAVFLLLGMPDTQVTNALCLNIASLQQGQGWWGFLTSGFCNSGLAATWLCCAALDSCGHVLEEGSSQLQMLTIFLICTLFSSCAHIFAGQCALGAMGPGVVLGVYTTWSILAVQYMHNILPVNTILAQAGIMLLLMLALGLLQPAVSAASVIGGVLGGAVAVVACGPVSEVIRWCLVTPVMAVLLLVKLSLDLLVLLGYAVVFVAVGAWQCAKDIVVTIRRL